jgi:hypothetical protein
MEHRIFTHKKDNIMETNTSLIKIDNFKAEYTTKYKELTAKRVKGIEKVVRGSYEYEIFIHYLKHTLDLNRCAFYEGYSMKNGFTLELHHSPLTLFDITYTVCNKYLENNGFYETFPVAEEVVMLHYAFNVGLVPLNPTAHKLHHNDCLPIHPSLVKGDWERFVTTYKPYLTQETLLKVDDAKEFMKRHKTTEYPKILMKKEQFYSISNIKSIKEFDTAKMLMDNSLKKLNEL